MKLKKTSLLLMFSCLALLCAPRVAAAEAVYGHVSFVDNGARVEREDGIRETVMVNMPLATGDTIVTSAGGRCELQFDNGTIVRLDKGSRLRLATVLAPSLTTNWKITTLELERGQLYALPQSYAREMFQLVTPTAAVLLKTRVRAYVRLDNDGGTSLFSDGGKFQLLYGPDGRSLKKATVRSNRPLAVSADNALAEPVQERDIEFMAWNEYVDRHFQELHHGISKLPPKLKFGNSALTHWAEKWSSRYGEWIYDELFGYVWRPADERFAYAARPFFHADFTRVGGELFLVPQQAWGWVPAHMGTWVWMSRGWTWIPGEWFHPGIVDYSGLYSYPINVPCFGFPTFDYYWHKYRFWQSGWNYWPAGEPDWPHRPPKKPEMPNEAIILVKRVMKAPDGNDSKRLATEKTGTPIEGVKLPVVPKPGLKTPATGAAVRVGTQPAQKGGGGGMPLGILLNRDWNPDRRWAARRSMIIRYAGNVVVLPELGLSSDKVHGVDRVRLRESSRRELFGSPAAGARENSSSASDSAARAAGSSQDHSGERAHKDDGK